MDKTYQLSKMGEVRAGYLGDRMMNISIKPLEKEHFSSVEVAQILSILLDEYTLLTCTSPSLSCPYQIVNIVAITRQIELITR